VTLFAGQSLWYASVCVATTWQVPSYAASMAMACGLGPSLSSFLGAKPLVRSQLVLLLELGWAGNYCLYGYLPRMNWDLCEELLYAGHDDRMAPHGSCWAGPQGPAVLKAGV